MKIGHDKITGLIVSVIMLTVLLAVASTVIPTGSQAFYDLSTSLSNATVLGTGAVAFAADMPSYVGWFWVLGPFVLVIGLVVGLFFKGGNGRSR